MEPANVAVGPARTRLVQNIGGHVTHLAKNGTDTRFFGSKAWPYIILGIGLGALTYLTQ
jgi:hypothetical protein